MAEHAVLAVSITVICRDDDIRVVERSGRFQPAQQPPQMLVLMRDLGIVKVVDDLPLPVL